MIYKDVKEALDNYGFGKITKKWVIGDIVIGRYNDVIDNEILYHAWFCDKGKVVNTHNSYHTLERAIVGAMAYKYDGCNSQADIMFMRMLQKADYEE